MKGLLLFLLFTFRVSQTSHEDIIAACTTFDKLNTSVLDGSISKSRAASEFKSVLRALHQIAHEQKAGEPFYFPLRTYNYLAIGGVNGNGYIKGRYSYFDGNAHSGHPAHDIFIHDKNQDGFDDASKKEVEVLAVKSGYIVGMSNSWKPGSSLRGGNYIWLYCPGSNSLFYYAHNQHVKVHVGDYVKGGQVIATVGRTGKNACMKRSPTHLHFMELRVDTNYTPYPVNCYQDLKTARKTL